MMPWPACRLSLTVSRQESHRSVMGHRLTGLSGPDYYATIAPNLPLESLDSPSRRFLNVDWRCISGVVKRNTYTIMPYKTVIRLLGVARNPANGFPARLLETRTETPC